MDPVTLALAKSWAEGEFGDLRQLQQHIAALQTVSGLAPVAGELQAVSELAQITDDLQVVSALAPHVQALLDSRIVEMGSNSNGTYVRWENGLQVCWHWWTQHPFEGATYYVRSGNVTWTFPAAFAAVPATMVQGRPAFWQRPWQDASYPALDYGGLSITPSDNNSTPSQTSVRVVYWYRIYGGRLDMFAFAIGRWK